MPSFASQATLMQLFGAALVAAMPDGKFAPFLPSLPGGRVIVLGAGKGSARMAQALEADWLARYGTLDRLEGLVVTRYGHACPTQRIEIVEAAHPVPDEQGFATAQRILDIASTAGDNDLVLFLISGGASSLLSLPAAGVSFADKQQINAALLKSGAPIGAMNRVRKSLSAIKGGKLAAAAARAQLITFLISDVPGDDPGAIGSGPTIADPVTPDDVLETLARYQIEVPERLRRAIEANICPAPAPRHQVHMLATPLMALQAAAAKAQALGLNPVILSDCIEGEAREVAKVFAGLAQTQRALASLAARPMVLLSGGETSVTVRGKGRGGRNAEFLLALAQALPDLRALAALACDTDGIDGVEDNAGAWFDAALHDQAARLGLKSADYLANNDAYHYFKRLDRLVMTGPTLTNVNDFRAIIID